MFIESSYHHSGHLVATNNRLYFKTIIVSRNCHRLDLIDQNLRRGFALVDTLFANSQNFIGDIYGYDSTHVVDCTNWRSRREHIAQNIDILKERMIQSLSIVLKRVKRQNRRNFHWQVVKQGVKLYYWIGSFNDHFFICVIKRILLVFDMLYALLFQQFL